MVLSIFEHLKECIEASAETVIDKLEEININIFEPLLTAVENESTFTRDEAARIIMYIIYAYSQDSPWLIFGMDSTVEKTQIAERLGLPENLHDRVISLKSEVVRKVIIRYLETSTSRAFKYWSFKKDMYEAAMANGVLSMIDKEGNVDLKSMSAADIYMGKMLEELKEYEDQLRSEYKARFDNMEDLQNAESIYSKKRDGGNVEQSQHIT